MQEKLHLPRLEHQYYQLLEISQNLQREILTVSKIWPILGWIFKELHILHHKIVNFSKLTRYQVIVFIKLTSFDCSICNLWTFFNPDNLKFIKNIQKLARVTCTEDPLTSVFEYTLLSSQNERNASLDFSDAWNDEQTMDTNGI